MAMIDSAVLKPNVAYFYTAPVGTALPADLLKPEADAWVSSGHTSLEDIISATSEGGESTVLGSLQKRSLRSSQSPLTEGFEINLLQWDDESLTMYFGANVTESTDGRLLNVPSQPIPVQKAWLVVIHDGENVAGFHSKKAEFLRSGDISISDTESLAQLPVRITPLGGDGEDFPYSVIKPHKPSDVVPGVVPGP